MINDRLVAALMAQTPTQQKNPATQANRVALAMARRARDAKYASLAALPPYGESKNADRLAGSGAGPAYGTGTGFQIDAFQNDAYQV